MSVSEEELAAYADGELTGPDAERIGAAIAADPALAVRVDAEKRLRALLRGHLDPVLTETMPESLTLTIAAAAAEDTEAGMSDAQSPEPALSEPASPQPARILDFTAARARRQQQARAAARPRFVLPKWWGTGAAIAASLALGLFFGMRTQDTGVRVTSEGALVATGMLSRGLDERLASANESGKMRILTSFRLGDGGYCRVYDAGATSGIACKDQDNWILERTATSDKAQSGEYRQAGSAQQDLMAAAQAMAAGEPLDEAQEQAARAAGWRK
ncbi:transcriptional regulator [Novosphingobium guangzhouense]|uniref:Transcriptional regulator n=1 Tax=Novosphingobium guangzhouense TaxID=1850347 RepID=A0A2K2FWM8_9SPHN|nr:transcriptional regulator [Novosphingobium guangzhouense]PNU03174.1 transcriptional regulator [Novosphingobium guangzhouense]